MPQTLKVMSQVFVVFQNTNVRRSSYFFLLFGNIFQVGFLHHAIKIGIKKRTMFVANWEWSNAPCLCHWVGWNLSHQSSFMATFRLHTFSVRNIRRWSLNGTCSEKEKKRLLGFADPISTIVLSPTLSLSLFHFLRLFISVPSITTRGFPHRAVVRSAWPSLS